MTEVQAVTANQAVPAVVIRQMTAAVVAAVLACWWLSCRGVPDVSTQERGLAHAKTTAFVVGGAAPATGQQPA